ncbi:TetR/AcrR family transcriptional regulator [Kitasatospora indigofera]|uniref:TetR/AcrR family transcriptional regulator n=1 Tax=Kitasatospora indigofera TaxID=67307 RepID=UPI003662C06C
MSAESPATPRGRRADAERNRERILEAARTVVGEQGTQASLRDVARRADVGLGTLYRHFPTREDLLETLLRERFDGLATRAADLGRTLEPAAALTEWLSGFIVSTGGYRGLAGSLMATLNDPDSPLHASCVAMRQAAGDLLGRAQEAGRIRPDIDGTDLFTLVNALGWIADQAPSEAGRGARLFTVFMDGLAVAPGATAPGPAAP